MRATYRIETPAIACLITDLQLQSSSYWQHVDCRSTDDCDENKIVFAHASSNGYTKIEICLMRQLYGVDWSGPLSIVITAINDDSGVGLRRVHHTHY